MVIVKIQLGENIYSIDVENENDVRFMSFMLAGLYYGAENDEEKQEAACGFCTLLKSYIWKILRHNYSTYEKYYDDMEACGMMGVLIALQKKEYDPAILPPANFFAPYICHEIRHYVVTEILHVTPYYASALKKIRAARNKLEMRNEKITNEAIHRETGLTMETVINTITLKNRMGVIEQLGEALPDIDSEDSSRKGYIFVEPAPNNTEDEICHRVLVEELMEAIHKGAHLTEFEKEIIKRHYGIEEHDKMSLAEIATVMNTTLPQVKSGLRYAKFKLRNHLGIA